MGDEDRPSFLDREKKSFAELDRMRRERRDGRDEPRSPGSRQRAKQATDRALDSADQLFSKNEAKQLSAAVFEARGTPGLAEACRAYHATAGLPTEVRLIACFLDAGDPAIALVGLAGARAGHDAGALEVTPGLRSQLRMLAEGPDDSVADAAEALLDEF